MQIIFENSQLILVEKLAGWLSTPSRHAENDPRPVLGRQLQEKKGIQIYPVNRLDFEVSGLIVFAKDPKSHATANFWFENRLIKKTYEAVSEGDPSRLQREEKIVWKSMLQRGKRRTFESPHGKMSETWAFYQGHEDRFLKWRLEPLTGRPHQLRVHMSMHGFPILGDELYGSTVPYKPNEIALRATKLDFTGIPDRLGLPEIVSLP